MKAYRNTCRAAGSRSAKLRVVVCRFAAAIAFGGCASSRNPNLASIPSRPTTQIVAEPAEYRLGQRDVLEVKFFYQPELNETLTIRPDGKISLQLIGEIRAAGMTPAALSDLLTQKYGALLRKPEVTVIVKDVAPRRIYVAGEVNTPGLMPLTDQLTILQAIMQAGGYKKTGELGSVIVLRNQGSATPLMYAVNLKGNLRPDGKILPQDMLVEPQDIVFVPQTLITKMNDFVEQYIDKMIPVQRSIGVFYELGPAATNP
jgi:polysaccharide biosynthesis/export protein